jgi:peroxiredoxin
MVATASNRIPLGTALPAFRLQDAFGRWVSSSDFKDAPALLVVFMCNHCPYVKHVQMELADLITAYQTKGVTVVGINPNDAEAYPDDSPGAMAAASQELGYTFPFLVDADQSVAKAFGASCTPDFFLYDGERRLAYHGQMDFSRPGNRIPVTGGDLRAALNAVLAGKAVHTDQKPSLGCNIKWKPGNKPAGFA